MQKVLKMKALNLPQIELNIQKCLLPNCKFIQKNFGQYCLITLLETRFTFIVKLGLYKIKNVENCLFDCSVSTYSSLRNLKTYSCFKDLVPCEFSLLEKPSLAKEIEVIIVTLDMFDVVKFSSDSITFSKILRDILKMFTFCKQSLISLSNLRQSQKFGINSIIITYVDNSKPYQLYEICAFTKINVKSCLSQLQFQNLQNKYSDVQIGGYNKAYSILKEIIKFRKASSNKIKVAKKLLLIGPCGCGKTILVRNIANRYNFILLEVSASDFNSLNLKDSEIHMRTVFKKAKIYASCNDHCIILIKNIDIMQGKKTCAKRFVRLLLTLLEEVENIPEIMVIATTNCPDNIDFQLRKSTIFEDELEILMPSAEEREDIISKWLSYNNIKCDKNLIEQLSKLTPGFVGADLHLILLQGLLFFYKIQGSLAVMDNSLLNKCWKMSLTKIIPSALRGAVGFSVVQDNSFNQIGGLNKIKKILELSVKQQLNNPAKFHLLGVPPTKGILLYGPPGCAKTTLVKALAKECSATFLATSAAELYSSYVGETEKKIVQLFTQARLGSPTIIFIDEIDAIVGTKNGSREQGVQERILSSLLTEMDGIGIKVSTHQDNSLSLLCNKHDVKTNLVCKKGINNRVIVVGATNRPHLLDSALRRPGRFDKLLYIPPPDEVERLQILKKLTEKMPLHESVNLEYLAKLTDYYSGADLKNLCQESCLYALNISNMMVQDIHQYHFEHVLTQFKPSLNSKIIRFYEFFQNYNI